MSSRISSFDIQPGDKLRIVDELTVVARKVETPPSGADARLYTVDGAAHAVRLDQGWARRFYLVERPQPKPEPGQHWYDPKKVEHIVVKRGDALYLPPIDGDPYKTPAAVRYDAAAAVHVMPEGWTLKQ